MAIWYGISGYRRKRLLELRIHLLAGEDEHLPALAANLGKPTEEQMEYRSFERSDAITQILGEMFPLTLVGDVHCGGNSIRSALEDILTQLYAIAYNQGWNDRDIP